VVGNVMFCVRSLRPWKRVFGLGGMMCEVVRKCWCLQRLVGKLLKQHRCQYSWLYTRYVLKTSDRKGDS